MLASIKSAYRRATPSGDVKQPEAPSIVQRPIEGQAIRSAKESRPKAAEHGCTSLVLAQVFTGEFPQEVGRLARLAGGGEDGAVVLFQKRQPIIDIRGVAEFAVHAEVGAEERRGQLGD